MSVEVIAAGIAVIVSIAGAFISVGLSKGKIDEHERRINLVEEQNKLLSDLRVQLARVEAKMDNAINIERVIIALEGIAGSNRPRDNTGSFPNGSRQG